MAAPTRNGGSSIISRRTKNCLALSWLTDEDGHLARKETKQVNIFTSGLTHDTEPGNDDLDDQFGSMSYGITNINRSLKRPAQDDSSSVPAKKARHETYNTQPQRAAAGPQPLSERALRQHDARSSCLAQVNQDEDQMSDPALEDSNGRPTGWFGGNRFDNARRMRRYRRHLSGDGGGGEESASFNIPTANSSQPTTDVPARSILAATEAFNRLGSTRGSRPPTAKGSSTKKTAVSITPNGIVLPAPASTETAARVKGKNVQKHASAGDALLGIKKVIPSMGCPFLTMLTRDIRQEILRYLLVSDSPIRVLNGWTERYARCRPNIEPTILRVCRMVHSEGIPILYSENNFQYIIRDAVVAVAPVMLKAPAVLTPASDDINSDDNDNNGGNTKATVAIGKENGKAKANANASAKPKSKAKAKGKQASAEFTANEFPPKNPRAIYLDQFASLLRKLAIVIEPGRTSTAYRDATAMAVAVLNYYECRLDTLTITVHPRRQLVGLTGGSLEVSYDHTVPLSIWRADISVAMTRLPGIEFFSRGGTLMRELRKLHVRLLRIVSASREHGTLIKEIDMRFTPLRLDAMRRELGSIFIEDKLGERQRQQLGEQAAKELKEVRRALEATVLDTDEKIRQCGWRVMDEGDEAGAQLGPKTATGRGGRSRRTRTSIDYTADVKDEPVEDVMIPMLSGWGPRADEAEAASKKVATEDTWEKDADYEKNRLNPYGHKSKIFCVHGLKDGKLKAYIA